MTDATLLLSLLIFLPTLGALILAFLPSDKPDLLKYFTLGVTAIVFALTIMGLLLPGGTAGGTGFNAELGTMQNVVNLPWIPSFNIQYFLGVDGISFPLVMLTGFVTLVSMGASWTITKFVKGYCILYLLLFTGMMGVFLSLDFFLFYVFWEVMLLPMYFLIGVWGGPRKEYAAIKFFLYTLFGSVLMLVAILMLYFTSDLRALAESEFVGASPNAKVKWNELHLGQEIDAQIGRAQTASGIVFLRQGAGDKPLGIEITATDAEAVKVDFDAAANAVKIALGKEKKSAADVVAAFAAAEEARKAVAVGLSDNNDGSGAVDPKESLSLPAYHAGRPVHTFNLLALAAIGQHTEQFDGKIIDLSKSYFFQGTWVERCLSGSLQWWAFLLLFIGFIIKVPSVPLHTWLPDAHVEAPTPISMILAGVLLKMGGYGIIRICYPICPSGGYELAYLVCGLGVISMVYGAFAALAQKDFKRLVAYSSVSHMGYVVLGLGVWSATAGNAYNPDYWAMGVMGAMFQMIGHGVCSPGMFFMVGIIYERVHHRNLDEFGGLFSKMPVYTAMALGIFFAGLGLPGLCGFIGEAVVVFSIWKYSQVLAVISAAVVIITAGYILWCLQRVYLGPEYKGPHGDHIHPSDFRENLIGMTLLGFCILLGVVPHQTVFKYMEATVNRQVGDLTRWTELVKEPQSPSPAVGQGTPVAPQKLSAVSADGSEI